MIKYDVDGDFEYFCPDVERKGGTVTYYYQVPAEEFLKLVKHIRDEVEDLRYACHPEMIPDEELDMDDCDDKQMARIHLLREKCCDGKTYEQHIDEAIKNLDNCINSLDFSRDEFCLPDKCTVDEHDDNLTRFLIHCEG